MVRLAKIDDLPQINELRRQVHELHAKGRADIFQPEFGEELENCIYDAYDDDNSYIIVADIDEKVCGLAVCEIIDKPSSPYNLARRFFRVTGFCVDKSCRRQGVGTQIFEYIKLFAADKGLSTIELDVWEFNESALNFYEALGFKTYRRYMELKA